MPNFKQCCPKSIHFARYCSSDLAYQELAPVKNFVPAHRSAGPMEMASEEFWDLGCGTRRASGSGRRKPRNMNSKPCSKPLRLGDYSATAFLNANEILLYTAAMRRSLAGKTDRIGTSARI